jgi:hypothetical protein
MRNTNTLQTVEKGLVMSPIEKKRRVNVKNVDVTKLLSIYSEYERCKFIEINK